MEYLIICCAAFLGSALTFFSGFGLGTVLVPVFALFFPIEISIALTAIVHFLNNLFKLYLVGKRADVGIVLRFGIPSVIAAFLGAYLLTVVSDFRPLVEYSVDDRVFQVMPVKIVISVLLIVFALFDILPTLKSLSFDRKYLPIGGFLSGFFGGLSGNQGALRSAFLIKANLTKEVFIATGVVIAVLIDISRLTVYSKQIISNAGTFDYNLIIAATLSAFIGAYIGNRLLTKITINTVQSVVAGMLFLFAILLGLGII